MSQLNVYDLAMLMAVSNAVQNAMTGGLGNFTVGLVTSSVVVVSAWVLTRLLARRPGLQRRVLGSPTVLVQDGQVLRGRMRRERITDADLGEALRAHGIETPAQAGMVVLEVDGSLSVVPLDQTDRQRPRGRRRDRKRRRRVSPRGGSSR